MTGCDHTHEDDATINLKVPRRLLKQDRFFYIVPWKYKSRDKKLLDIILSDYSYPVTPETLLTDPSTWKESPFCEAMSAINKKSLEVLTSADVFRRLSKSQLDAVKDMISSHLTLLWGPPQTGTSSVLATLVVVFAKAMASLGGKETMHVLFTAKSDDVMDHFLEEVKNKRQDAGLTSSQLAIGSMEWADKEKIKTIEGPYRDPTQFYSDNKVCVVAGSVHKIANDEFTSGQTFEIVIWDEAHLFDTNNLFFALKLLDRQRSRLIFAGDSVRSDDHSHKFCANCIPVNDFVTPEFVFQASKPLSLTKPIFDCLHDHLEGASVLSENWHLTDTMCNVIRDEFYPPKLFHNAILHPGIPQAPLNFTLSSIPPGLNGQIFDHCFGHGPGIGVVLFLWDKKPSFTNGHFEDDHVIGLYKTLRSCEELKKKREAEFWSENFMIACVSHSQSDSISRKLKSLDGISESTPIVVKTLEHLHDLKRDVCLVDLAVFNSDKVAEDPNKFFNPQTLVTYLSRGKKCILFISEHVLTAYNIYPVMGVEKWLHGLNILRDIVINAEKQGCLVKIPPPL